MLGLRPRDLPGLHDVRPGRHPLPGSRGRRRARAGPRARRPERDEIARALRPVHHLHAHRDERRRVPARVAARRRDQRHRQLDLRERRALRPGRGRRRVVAPRHRAVPALRAAAPRTEHARPLVHRPRARELPRALALPAPLRRVRAGRLRRRPRLVAERPHRGRFRRDLGAHGRGAHPRMAPHLRVRRAGARPRRPEPRVHLPRPGGLDRRSHRRPHRRRGAILAFLALRKTPALATLAIAGVGVLSIAVAMATSDERLSRRWRPR